MNKDDYPAIYKSASKIAKDSQLLFCWLFGINIVLLTFAVALSVFYVSNIIYIYVQLIILVSSFLITGLLGYLLPEKSWYGGRALAESTKTMSWRYMMKAEPFNIDDKKATDLFLKKLGELVKSNKELTSKSVTSPKDKQLTDFMKDMRTKTIKDRKAFYVEYRIVEQLTWYLDKSEFNKKRAKQFFVLILISSGFAILFSILRINCPITEHWPTDIFVAIVSALLGWNQAKKYRELTTSYAQTAHEISLIKEQASYNQSKDKFSIFVSDAENAFSREHVQWLARRDV